jgi:xylulokinase
VVESSEVSGTVTEAAAAATGLEAGTPVVGGAGDQAASAVGNGIVEEGVVSCTLGTSGVVFAHLEKASYDPRGRVHTFCHAVKGKWHVMGVTQGAGLSLQWFRNQLMPGTGYDVMTAEAAQSPPGSQGLFWLPYLMGERTPHLDASARGGWIGITAKHSRADLIRAVIEGVSYSQKDCLEIVEGLGVPVEAVRASGGGGQNPFWRQVLADMFGKRVASLETQEGSAYGAALLAMAGTGHYASVPEACRATIREVGSVAPRAHEFQIYKRGYEVYKALYPCLRPLYGLIGSLE